MRLKEPQVKHLCQKVLLTLRAKQLIILKRPESEILAKMEAIFVKDLKVEEEIDREAKRLVEQYADKAGGSIDRQKMFTLIKRQLVKDRNAVI
jgi:hypothetical protein